MSFLVRIAAGDPCAFDELHREYKGLFTWIAKKHFRCPHAISDVLQEIFLRIWKFSHYYDPSKGKENNYLTILAKRTCYLVWRRQRSLNAEEFHFENLQDEHDYFALDNCEEAQKILDLAATLEPELRETFTAVFWEGKTRSEFAREKGWNKATSTTNARKAIAKVQKRYQISQLQGIGNE